jgi:hypothetical protein
VVTINNDDMPSVSVQAAASVTEGNSGSQAVTLTVTLSNAWSSTVTVTYATSNGTATAGSDYVAKSGTLTFAAGVTAQTITLTVNGDTTKEANETFNVTLSSPLNATLGTATGVVTIVNDDGSPLLAASLPDSRVSTELTPDQLDAAVASAKQAWLAADPGADLSGITFAIGDLPGSMLGVTGIGAITIDPTAAGWGWTVDGGAMDLETVVLHELGHALGLGHEATGLMAETLAPGIALGVPEVSHPQLVSAAQVTASIPPAPATVVAPALSIRFVRASVLRPSTPARRAQLVRQRHRRSGRQA